MYTNFFQFLFHADFHHRLGIIKNYIPQAARATLHKFDDIIEKTSEGQDLNDQVLIPHPTKCVSSTA